MTDNEIIKALECCSTEHCKKRDCPLFDCARNTNDCIELLSKNSLDLINRQKAEIERFKKIEATINAFWCELKKLITAKGKETPTLEELLEHIEQVKTEAIKEFGKILKEEFDEDYAYSFESIENRIDNLVKEMVGEG